jgi:hypothetical protein
VHDVCWHESNEFEEAVRFFGELLQDAQQETGDERIS